MKLIGIIFLAIASALLVLGQETTPAAGESVSTTHDIAVYAKFTAEGVSSKPIVWYNGRRGKTAWQATWNFEATDSVALKIGRTVKLRSVSVTPFAGVVAGRSNYLLAEAQASAPLGSKSDVFTMGQMLRGLGTAQSYGYLFNSVSRAVRKSVKLQLLTQHTFTPGDKPSNEIGAGATVDLGKGFYAAPQAWQVLGGQRKILVGFGRSF